MVKQLRYTTFAPGELEARLRELAPKGTLITPLSLLNGNGNGGNGAASVKAHCTKVRYPDGREGECRYERGGAQWHVFHCGYDNQPLPRQIWMQSLRNDVASIESKAQEMAEAAYREAIVRERQDYFARASEPSDGSRKRNPALYRLSAGRAKEWAGKYALCQTIGQTLSSSGPVFETLDAANAAWQKQGDTALVVGCCNRLDRCWQLPRFNPLYAAFDPRPKSPMTDAETTTVDAARNEEPETVPLQEGSMDPKGIQALETDRGMSADAPRALDTENTGVANTLPQALACEETGITAEPEAFAFTRWMTEVTQNLEALYGLEPDDLPDCTYADWFASDMTAEEAAREAMALFLDA